MCRLFGLTAGTARIQATFWLLDAPDSLEVQSHRNADGSGIGYFGPAGEPVLDKQPEPAFSDQEFTHAAKQAELLGLRRARPLGEHRRAFRSEHAPVRHGGPDHGAQRRLR